MVKIAIVSQKGGTGKSAIARALATAYEAADWSVTIADMDERQSTATRWLARRDEHYETSIKSVVCSTATQAAEIDDELVVFDGAPESSRVTAEIAEMSDLVVIPTGLSVDDLEPSVLLARELDACKVCFVINRATSSVAEYDDAVSYITDAGFYVAPGRIEDKSSYRRAHDAGLSIIETQYKTTRAKADAVIQAIINRVEAI